MKSSRQLLIWMLALTGSYAVADGTKGHSHSAGSAHVAQATSAVAATMVDGEVRKVDVKSKKLTLRHGRIASLNMSPMTMVYRVKDPLWLQSLQVGDKIRFAADRVNGYLTVIALDNTKAPQRGPQAP